jgi:hypothetical protein
MKGLSVCRASPADAADNSSLSVGLVRLAVGSCCTPSAGRGRADEANVASAVGTSLSIARNSDGREPIDREPKFAALYRITGTDAGLTGC